jgi:hypothetical protein
MPDGTFPAADTLQELRIVQKVLKAPRGKVSLAISMWLGRHPAPHSRAMKWCWFRLAKD